MKSILGIYSIFSLALFTAATENLDKNTKSGTNEKDLPTSEEDLRPNNANLVIFYIANTDILQKALKIARYKDQDVNADSGPHLSNIKKLINKSVEFKYAYGEMTSTSSAASLLTGKHAVDIGIIQGKILPYIDFPSLASSGGLFPSEKTIGNILHQYGHYRAYVGQWALGVGGGLHLPVKHGFDVWTGFVTSNEDCSNSVKYPQNKNKKSNRHPYSDFIIKRYPFWIGVLASLLTMYYFEWLHLRGLANAFVYSVCLSLILYILLKILEVKKLSACVLYRNMDIIEQPYDTSNATLYTTLKALKFLQFSSEAGFPFYLHLSFTLGETSLDLPKNGSFGSTKDDLAELDWSIGKIMTALEKYEFDDKTVIVLAGGSDCFTSSKTGNFHNTKIVDEDFIHGYSRKGLSNFKIHLYKKHVSFENCLNIPLILHFPGMEQFTFYKDSIVSLADILVTIENLMGKERNENFTEVKALACSLVSQKCPATTDGRKASMTGNESSSIMGIPRGKDNIVCGFGNRALFHYADIIKPVAVTLSGPVRIVFSNVTDTGKVVPLSEPVIFMLSKEPSGTEVSNSYLESLFQNASRLVEQHLVEDRPNRWTSQYEMPIYPWYFPCANFPRCEKSRAPDNFAFLDLH